MSDKTGLLELWTKFFGMIKRLTGDVKVSEKGTLQAQIDGLSDEVTECFTSVSNGKTLVASAITDKGVITAADAEFATMATNISSIVTDPTLQAKTAALSTAEQTITADSGYDGLSQVTVPAVGGTANIDNVLAGYTFNSASGIWQTGTLPNRYNTTVDAYSVYQDDTYTYFAPYWGVYNEYSRIRALNSNLKKSNNICFGFCERQTAAFSFTTVDTNANVSYGLNISNSEFANTYSNYVMTVKSKSGGTYIITTNYQNSEGKQTTKTVSAGGVIYSYEKVYAETYCIIKE